MTSCLDLACISHSESLSIRRMLGVNTEHSEGMVDISCVLDGICLRMSSRTWLSEYCPVHVRNSTGGSIALRSEVVCIPIRVAAQFSAPMHLCSPSRKAVVDEVFISWSPSVSSCMSTVKTTCAQTTRQILLDVLLSSPSDIFGTSTVRPQHLSGVNGDRV